MNRRLSRLRAVQALYQMDLTDTDKDSAIQSVLEEEEENNPFLDDLITGTLEKKAELDQVITSHLQGWTIDRIGNVDRAILRMALYELQYVKDIPLSVSFNEAIELAKAFGGEEAGRFVNGILSKAVEKIKLDNQK
ncbi:transcription antitermination factor NusB [Halalkalibacterium ligniniphilum]|uniref:transcription antitermination factor NusB n=1 Tax=Halalkalibacterium ligniniphilum TaxID=1134413 RepID=UPI00034B8F34|nr:transcription antitermination factor NusB [Halalkalibacterium ligniniphilum]